ncbi:diaminopimelate decarboxylase [Butyricimonas hominis]|uniref:Diaminopimelate decarboxylase n=1 Tax=Butyricimonas hominis TaxID=2763032 RepID=A0ABR7D6V5_9BACT|nr:diaminopimelate decarboxylase [Butyricimonas hominis]MBC5623645.1 diaminopimelate decarboxylase [Butyricimonas hominis]
MNIETVKTFQSLKTPFYYYDTALLRATLQSATQEANRHGFHLHYAVKANANPRILEIIQDYGIGADCVSGNEVARAVEYGFHPDRIVYAGVGKSDDEIRLALGKDIFCFNCESLPEIEVINTLAGELGKKASIALRVNPNVDAHTHHYITTGIEENKFGFYLYDLEHAIAVCRELENIRLIGLHFHIGSQITDLTVFRGLCLRVNEIQARLKEQGIILPHVNFGGGLGINYDCPSCGLIPDFASYFQTFADFFEAQPGQQLHFELGRSLVGQCGSLVSRVLYVKEGKHKKFVILDAGMNDLLRPALYQAFHRIENLTSIQPYEKYDIVGPICESSDCFGKDRELPATRRGDLIAIRSCGAYGEVMASRYNLRDLPGSFFPE